MNQVSFCSKRMKTIQASKVTIILAVILLNKGDNFLLQYNLIFFKLKSLKEQLVFHALSYVLKRRQDIFVLRAIVRLFLSSFFQPSFSDG